MGRLLNAAFASNTHKTYLTGWKMFCRFLRRPDSVLTPAEPEDVRRFIAWLSLQSLAASTINTYVSAVGYYHRIYGWSDPTSDYLVAKLLQGCRRGRASTDSRQPVSIPMLKTIIRSLLIVSSSSFEARLFKTVFLFAFFGFMRVGEFAADSRHSIPASVLLFSDVQICRQDDTGISVTVSFRHSKNNQCGPPQVIRFVKAGNVILCPVVALQEFLEVRPPVSGPLFCHFDGTPLTRYQFNAVLRKVLSFTDTPEGRVKGHSFRIGAASTAASMGISVEQISSMGRWRSPAVTTYMRPVPTCSFLTTSCI